MGYDFNASEILLMAEKIEQNGAKFYRTCAEGVSDLNARQLLVNLASMEEKHEKTFQSMRSRLSDSEKQPTAFDPENETLMYLKALADTRVFFKKTVDTSSLQEILKDAIHAEKDSIVFYLGMKEMVPPSLGRERIDAIIKEEMGHITLLSRHLVALDR